MNRESVSAGTVGGKTSDIKLMLHLRNATKFVGDENVHEFYSLGFIPARLTRKGFQRKEKKYVETIEEANRTSMGVGELSSSQNRYIPSILQIEQSK